MATGFGIVGCGMIAGFHAKAIADLQDAEVAACFDMLDDFLEQFHKSVNFVKSMFSLRKTIFKVRLLNCFTIFRHMFDNLSGSTFCLILS